MIQIEQKPIDLDKLPDEIKAAIQTYNQFIREAQERNRQGTDEPFGCHRNAYALMDAIGEQIGEYINYMPREPIIIHGSEEELKGCLECLKEGTCLV